MNDTVFIVGLLLGLPCLATAQQPTAQIAQGALKGVYMNTVSGRKIAAFLGVPYAKPPVGKHRFKQSIPAGPWEGVYNATSHSDFCMQYNQFTLQAGTPVVGSEDCLYINVYTPRVSPATVNTELLDVVVYIHGGAFMFLGSSYYGPEYLLDRDLVMVTFNYRLGVLGFLSTEDNVVPGNSGMKDQVLALQWVKRNIAAFGGNPNSITLTGLSAGGASVHYHMLSPLSQGLFNKAVTMGGSAFCMWTQMENAREKTMKIAAYLGCPTNDSTLTVRCLRDRPARSMVDATSLLMGWRYNPFSPFSIVIEPPNPNAFIAEPPIDIILKGTAADVPLLVTVNSDEGLYPGSEIIADSKLMEEVDRKWNELMPFIMDYNYTAPAGQMANIGTKAREFYMGSAKIADAKRQFIKMLGDRVFYSGIIKSTKLHAQLYSSPVYAYLFSHHGKEKYVGLLNIGSEEYGGTSHGTDCIYIIRGDYLPIENNATNMIVSRRLIDYLLTFIKGAPMPKGWPPVKENLPEFSYLEIQNVDEQNDIVRTDADYGNEKFWDSLNLNENLPLTNVRVKQEL